MLGNSISILYSAILSDQKALQIRNRNIANADNPDYAKEEPALETLPSVGGDKGIRHKEGFGRNTPPPGARQPFPL